MWKILWSLSPWETHDNLVTSKTIYDGIGDIFLVKSGTLSISLGRN
jgi:hypothetical protein